MSTQLTGDILTPAGVLTHHTLTIDEAGVIASIAPAAADTPADAALILPGLADIHTHGGAGESFPTSTAEGCAVAAHHHRSHGSTTLLASLVSGPGDHLVRQTALLADLAEDDLIDGIHAEGPFVNPGRCGAQDPRAIIPGDPALFTRICEAGRGQLKSITFAPETAHARELVDICADYGVIASLGHTDADFSVTADLIAYAATKQVTVTATHLFNAMPPIHHRNPGAAAALISAATRALASVELVADGVHLDDHTVEMILDTVGADGVTFVSDAMGAAGQADGDYILGDLAVTVSGGVARLTTTDGSEGAIAGGTSCVMDQVKRHLAAGRDLTEVLTAATTGHRLLGYTDRGYLAVGARADLILTDRDATQLRVYRGGRPVPTAA